MKKLQSILVIMLMAVIPMLFVACEDNSSKKDKDKEKKGTIIGEWKCIGIDITIEMYGEKITESEDWSEENVIWEFTKDGNHYIYYNGEEEEHFEYTLENDLLYTGYADYFGTSYGTITKLTSKVMDVEFVYESEDMISRNIYHFKR